MVSEWNYTIELPPIPTPRPNFKKEGTQSVTYYSEEYQKYLENVSNVLINDKALNDNFFEVMASKMGVKAEVIFYVQAPKSQKSITNIMRTTAPDIDNLIKASLDSVFNGLKTKDSRIVMISSAKFQELENPRTEIRFKGIGMDDESLLEEFAEEEVNHNKEWRFVINQPPMATPRPDFTVTKDGRTITYYPDKYKKYMQNVQEQLTKEMLLNDKFFEVMASKMGVKAELIYYVQAPKSQKKLKNIMRTTAPDIDNLIKATLDSVFKGLKIKDSRIVMINAVKFQELENPRTEIILKGVGE